MSDSDNRDRDVSPSKNSFPEAKRGESFDEAANKPNNPNKPVDFNKGSYNPTYEYRDKD